MQLSKDQTVTLRHMLGIDVDDVVNPTAYRDYYCANPGDEHLHQLQRLGLVVMYSNRDGYEWFKTTDTGKAAARASQRAMLLPKAARRYRRWLSIRDALPDLSFRDFLTQPEFANDRANA